MTSEHRSHRWRKWLEAGGDALKWLVVGSFTLAAANLSAPHIASFIEALHQSAPRQDYAFFLIGGLIGAVMGAIGGNKRSGLLTALLTFCVAAGFYFVEGGPTQEQCRRVPERMQELTQEQLRILRTWVTCVKDDSAEVCSESPRSGRKLDELRSRKDYLWKIWRDDC